MKKVLLSLLTIAVVGALITGGVMAYFTDTATSETNTFTAGILSIDEDKVSESAAIIIDNMAPGDVTEEFVIIIVNDGSIDLAWLGDWQFTGSPKLMNALYIDYMQMEFLGGSWAEPTDNFITDGRGDGLYPTWYNTLADLSTFEVISFNNWNNNAGMAPGTVYEHAGALKPGYSYKLTVRFGFAALAGNGYQNLGPVTAQLKVDATQINSAAIQAFGVSAATADEWTKTNGFMPTQIANQTQ